MQVEYELVARFKNKRTAEVLKGIIKNKGYYAVMKKVGGMYYVLSSKFPRWTYITSED